MNAHGFVCYLRNGDRWVRRRQSLADWWYAGVLGRMSWTLRVQYASSIKRLIPLTNDNTAWAVMWIKWNVSIYPCMPHWEMNPVFSRAHRASHTCGCAPVRLRLGKLVRGPGPISLAPFKIFCSSKISFTEGWIESWTNQWFRNY